MWRFPSSGCGVEKPEDSGLPPPFSTTFALQTLRIGEQNVASPEVLVGFPAFVCGYSAPCGAGNRRCDRRSIRPNGRPCVWRVPRLSSFRSCGRIAPSRRWSGGRVHRGALEWVRPIELACRRMGRLGEAEPVAAVVEGTLRTTRTPIRAAAFPSSDRAQLGRLATSRSMPRVAGTRKLEDEPLPPI
jgi:hypothetical protein